MYIEIHEREVEAIIQQRLATGRFRYVEEVLLDALRCQGSATSEKPRPSLVDILEEAHLARWRGTGHPSRSLTGSSD